MLLRFFILLISTISLSACFETPYTNLDNAQLKTMMDQGVPVYDVRRIDEWRQTGVIKGSKLLTFVNANGQMQADFMPRFSAEVNKDDTVILICRTGNRSGTLARHLVEKMGYTHVYNVRNGITQWIREGQATEPGRF